MLVQILLTVFLLFVLSRVILQLRSAQISIATFIFWGGLFLVALVGVLDPRLTVVAAGYLGIGRGADVIIYLSIALIFYLIFRLSINLEETRREISELVRSLALKEQKQQKTNSPKRTK